MWKSLAITAAALALLAAGFTAAVAVQPARYRVTRSVEVAAPQELARAELVDPQRWSGWWPLARADQDAQRTFGGPPSGAGATCYWSSRGLAGTGRLTVVGDAPGLVEVELELETPEPEERDLEFALAPAGAGTRVTWSASGQNDLWRRVLLLAWSRDAELGPGLAQGLRQLQVVVEEAARTAPVRVVRDVRVAAPPEVVLAELADLRRWGDWSPWEGDEAGLQWSFGGPLTGVGASAYWSAEEAGGRGRLTLLEVGEGRVELEREVEDERPASSDHAFQVAADESGTRVTWAVSAARDAGDPSGRASAGEALGRDLERGLARLKAVVEADALGSP